MIMARDLRAALTSVRNAYAEASDREWAIVIGAAQTLCDVAEQMEAMNAPSPLAVVPYFDNLPSP
jgi:hypothetical protein